MASQFDREARLLERRRQIAQALRESGNEALPASLQTGGRFDAPVSGWQYADRALKQILGGLSERAANKAEKELTERQRAAQAEWMRGLPEAQAPDPLQPVAPTGQLVEGASQEQIARRVKGQDTFQQTQSAVNANDRERLLAHYLRGGDVGGLPAAIGAAGLQRELLPSAPEPFTLGEGDIRFSGAGKEVARGAPKTSTAGMELVDVIDPSSPLGYRTIAESDWIAQGRPPRWHRPPISVSVSNKEESEEAKAVGKGFGDMFNEIQAAGREATSKTARFDRMAQLLEGVNTGKLVPTFTQVAALGESFGVKLDENLGAKQALEALSNEIALTLRNPSGGAGMPGALSDKDREFLVSMTPGIGKTPEGNMLIIETGRALARRDREVAKLASDYRKKHGRMDEGFLDELQAFSEANPLFDREPAAPTPAAQPAPEGVDPKLWEVMTPGERALWQN